MAFVVLSECGLRPLPQACARPRSGIIPRPSKLRFLQTDRPATDLDFPGFCFYHNGPFPREMKRRGLNASAQSTAVEIDWEEKGDAINGVNGDWGHFNDGEEKVNGVYSDGEDFNHGAPPPFCLADIRAAIPKHCWIKDPWKSLSYVVRDVAIVFGLAAAASFLDNWLVWPLYWAAQGTMFWALFVLGHDCGHGSFSNNSTLNSAVGHLLHSSILVPYHGWRISHRTHHQNHGHVENDESWHPLSKKLFQSLDKVTKILRFTAPFPMFAFPVYLWVRSPGKTGSHFNPNSDLFMPCERKNVTTSTVCWTTMVALLVALNFALGPIQMIKLYGVPYLIFVMWLDLVTYLHHHGHEERLPWYRGVEWNYLRGGLTTLDRDYGWINNIHHDIGTHVIHHLFPQIPHYHLVEATEAAKPVLGKYYHEPKKSGPFPWYLLGSLIRSFQHDHYVSDEGDVVYYETEPKLYK